MLPVSETVPFEKVGFGRSAAVTSPARVDSTVAVWARRPGLLRSASARACSKVRLVIGAAVWGAAVWGAAVWGAAVWGAAVASGAGAGAAPAGPTAPASTRAAI